jgi:amino acid transporter
VTRKHKLARRLGLVLVTVYGLGNIVGAGIYALIGKVAGEAGIAAPITSLIAMLVAGLSALSFAELSSSHPYSEGATAYVHAAFKRKNASLVVGLLMGLATLVSAAALARAFGGYLNSATGMLLPIGAVLITLLLGLMAAWGIEESAKLAALLTIIEVIGLSMVIWFGRESLNPTTQNFGRFFDLTGVSFTGVLSGVFLAFYAYIGVEDMVHLSIDITNN